MLFNNKKDRRILILHDDGLFLRVDLWQSERDSDVMIMYNLHDASCYSNDRIQKRHLLIISFVKGILLLDTSLLYFYQPLTLSISLSLSYSSSLIFVCIFFAIFL